MTFDQFITKWSGRFPLYPPNPIEFSGECYQLFNFYNREVVDAPDFLAPYAYQIFTEFETSPLAPYYDKVEYTSGATPQRGDVVVWSPNLPGTDGAGHVGICTIPGVIIFESFDSNWQGKPAQPVQHDYSYVLGWLRPKGRRLMPTDQQIDETISLLNQVGYGDAAKPFVFVDQRPLLKNNYVEGVMQILTNIDNSPHAAKAKLVERTKALEKYQAMNGDASKWETLKALLRELLGTK